MFRDRKEAGQKLALALKKYSKENVIVYGLTRGGVPVAYEVAIFLNAPLEAFIVKKLGAPYQEELALGAVTEGENPVIYYNREILSHLNIREDDLKEAVRKKMKEITALQGILRQGKNIFLHKEAIAIVVDDGVATGSTIIAAIQFFRKFGQKKIVAAIPAGQISVLEELKKFADEVICVEPVSYMEAVGEFYGEFEQVESESVLRILKDAENRSKK